MKQLILMSLIALSSCGTDGYDSPKKYRSAGDGFSSAKTELDTFCAPCHQNSPFMASGSSFNASSARARVENGSMPPRGSSQAQSMSDEDRAKILGI